MDVAFCKISLIRISQGDCIEFALTTRVVNIQLYLFYTIRNDILVHTAESVSENDCIYV